MSDEKEQKGTRKNSGSILGCPRQSKKANEKTDLYMMNNVSRVSWQYNERGYFQPNVLFTPEEIESFGFVFVSSPVFYHDFGNISNPLWMPIPNSNRIVEKKAVKTYRLCDIGYFREVYGSGKRTWRGIQGVQDYASKIDIFRTMIVMRMKQLKLHYVYNVLLESSPCISLIQASPWPEFEYSYMVNVRGCKLP